MQPNPIAFLFCLHCRSPFPVYEPRQIDGNRQRKYCNGCHNKTWRYLITVCDALATATDDDCRIWPFAASGPGYDTGKGYGVLSVPPTRETSSCSGKSMVHHYSYERYVGPIPEGMDVCHTCDIPMCFRYSHLFVDTHKRNMHDMDAKGRRISVGKLTRQQIEYICTRCVGVRGEQAAIARELGVSPSVICMILAGKRSRNTRQTILVR
jgi:hypothetical protein